MEISFSLLFGVGGTVTQCLVWSPHRKKIPGSIHRSGMEPMDGMEVWSLHALPVYVG